MISWSQLRENTETWSFVAAIITMVLAVGWTIFLSALPIVDAFRGTQKEVTILYEGYRESSLARAFPAIWMFKRFFLAWAIFYIEVIDARPIVVGIFALFAFLFPFKSTTENVVYIINEIGTFVAYLLSALAIKDSVQDDKYMEFFVILSIISVVIINSFFIIIKAGVDLGKSCKGKKEKKSKSTRDDSKYNSIDQKKI